MPDHPVGPVAAIDCGTNSTRLLVVDGAGAPLVRLMRITRLGEGVDASAELSSDAVKRTVEVLREYRRKMDHFGVARARLVATSAVRDAANGQGFLEVASEIIGVSAELLSGEKEGRMAYAGATADLPRSDDNVVVDIGGGSTELIVQEHGRIEAVSLDIGCVRVTERYLRQDPPNPLDLASAKQAIDRELERALEAIPFLRSRKTGRRLIGLAGTVSTLAALTQGLTEYDPDRIHHTILGRHTVEKWCATLVSEPAAIRASLPGMVEGREDVIVGGVLVLQEVLRALEFDTCLVSEADLLDGLALGLLRAHEPSPER